MKNNLRLVSILMLASIAFSGGLLFYKISDVIIPSFSQNGTAVYVYLLCFIVAVSVVLKFLTGINAIVALSKNTSETEKQKKLTFSGKLAVPVIACGLLCLLVKLMYGDGFLVIDIFDIALDILLGIMFVVCSMYVRSGRE